MGTRWRGARGRLAGVLVLVVLAGGACGGGGDDDLVAMPRISGAVLGAVRISVAGDSVDGARVEPGTGVFVVPARRIVFGDVACSGDPDERLTVRADGELVETLERARLQFVIEAGAVEPAGGDHEVAVGRPDEGLAFVSVSGAEVDDDLVTIEGVYEPDSPRAPLAERYVGGSFTLVARCR